MSKNQMGLDMMGQMGISPELIQRGKQAAEGIDKEISITLEAAAPEGKYSAKSLQDITKALNSILKMFQAPALPMPEEDIEGSLPQEHINAIMMINAAIRDSGIGEELSLEELTDDRALKIAAGKLDSLSKDSGFKSFLAKPLPAEMESISVKVESEDEESEGMHEMPDGSMMKNSEMEDDELMMSRMR